MKFCLNWFNNMLCAIDVETTGLDPNFHEIWELAIIPLDSNCRPSNEYNPFMITIKPDAPDRIEWDGMGGNKKRLEKALESGFDTEVASKLFEDWVAALDLPLNKYGTKRNRIIPLGHNYQFDMAFIKAWLHPNIYELYFTPTYRDTLQVALYLNDLADFKGINFPFLKVDLAYLASTLKCNKFRSHHASEDARVTAEVYRRMLVKIRNQTLFQEK